MIHNVIYCNNVIYFNHFIILFNVLFLLKIFIIIKIIKMVTLEIMNRQTRLTLNYINCINKNNNS